MRRCHILLGLVLMFFICSHAAAQREQTIASRHLSKEDLHEYLVYKSRREKTKAIVTAVVGPILTGAGIYLYNLNHTTTLPDGSRREKNSSTRLFGILIGSLGVSTTICSIPLFLSAAETKKEARLVITQQSAAFLNKRIAVPGVGLRVQF